MIWNDDRTSGLLYVLVSRAGALVDGVFAGIDGAHNEFAILPEMAG